MTALRMVFFSLAGVILLGIALTGFDRAHGLLYVPVGFLAFAGATGICPGQIFWRRLGFRAEAAACDIDSQRPGKGG